MINHRVTEEQGLTLVEVLIAATILLIIVISFTALFTSSFRGIAGSGSRSETLFDLQESVESDIKSESAVVSGTRTLVFSDGTAIPGEHRSFKQDTADQKEVVIDVFVFTGP